MENELLISMSTLPNNSNRKRYGKRPRSVCSVSLMKSSVMLTCYLTQQSVQSSAADKKSFGTNRSRVFNEIPSSVTIQDENHQNSHHNVVRRREELYDNEESHNKSKESHLGNLEHVDFLNLFSPGEEINLTSNFSQINVSVEIDVSSLGVDGFVSSSDRVQESARISNISNDFSELHHQGQDLRNKEYPLHERFLTWCRDVLGIYAIVEIQLFEYVDFMNVDPFHSLEDDIEPSENYIETNQSIIKVRGLAAASDIEIGDVVIGIPLKALWSVTTLIDSDPILGGVMGPEARLKHGWNIAALDDQDDSADMMDLQFYEMPLLAVALLYHIQLGPTSLFAPYIDILKDTPTDSLPFLWSAQRIRSSSIASEGLRTVARGIRREMKEMYETVVKVLIDQHPIIFGKHTAERSGQDWMFSYERFQWAFAIINSRHWRLPIDDLEIIEKHESQTVLQKDVVASTAVGEQLPPADMPTEHWVKEHGDVDEELLQDPSILFTAARHSFLAPVADLLNFGPPCTRGRYNKDSQTFEIIASCSFRKGQEVTFWYSDECQHVVMGVYGFSHPLIPGCPTSEDLRLQNEVLEEELVGAFSELELVQLKLDDAEVVLRNCECSRYEHGSHDGSSLKDTTIAGSSVRGSSWKSMKREGKPRIRRTYSRRSEF